MDFIINIAAMIIFILCQVFKWLYIWLQIDLFFFIIWHSCFLINIHFVLQVYKNINATKYIVIGLILK